MIKLSVLMPVFNAKRYISIAVQSVLAQSFSEFELVIIDDGSTDGSGEILEAIAQDDQRVRLIRRENLGLVATLNEGLSYCRGTYVARMDADDISVRDRFAKQIEHLDRNPDCVLCGANRLLIDMDGDPLAVPRRQPCTHDEIDAAHMRGEVVFSHPTAMFRRAAVASLGGYRNWPIGEDYDLWLRLAEIGQVCILPEVLLHYRLSYSSYTSSRNDAEVVHQILKEAYGRRNIQGEPPVPIKSTCKSRYSFHQTCASRAVRGKNWLSARKHAIKCLSLRPLSKKSWGLVAAALAGR